MENFENYTKEQIIVDLRWANIFACIMMIPVLILYVVPFYLIWGFQGTPLPFELNFGLYALLIMVVIIAGVVVHEWIHGITWACVAEKGFKSIKFGILKKMFTPYCHCKEPLRIKHYVLGALMPLVILGIIPEIIALMTGYRILILFAFIFTTSAGGDILIVWQLRHEKKNDFVYDHPSEAGCYIYRKNESNNPTK
ncbi:MAG: DUF3267 domain-containing protein [Bacteroidales bacterium]|nr:DUF3267 domain-containing protein [Bacteroidales bacterium]